MPGEGNYWSPTENRVAIDPVDLKRSEDEWRGIVSHEGMHRRIDRFDFIPERILHDTGFQSLLYSINEIRMNTGVEKMFPGAGKWIKEAVSVETEEGGRLDYEKIKEKVGGKLGYIPKATEFCTEILRNWALGGFSEEQNPQVKTTLEGVSSFIDEATTNIPEKDAAEAEVLKTAKEVYVTTRRKVWREYKKLVEIDRENEGMRQFLIHLASEEGQEDLQIVELELDENEKEEFGNSLEQAKARVAEVEALAKTEAEKIGFLDFDAISPSLREKLLQAKEQIEEKKQQEIEKKAEENLKEAEDMLTESLRSQLANPAEQETHAEYEERMTLVVMRAEDEKETRERIEETRRLLRKEMEEKKPRMTKLTKKLLHWLIIWFTNWKKFWNRINSRVGKEVFLLGAKRV